MSKLAEYLMLAGITEMAMADDIWQINILKEKHSINEIIEKSHLTKVNLFELLNAEIIKGVVIFGVPYIVDDTIYSIEKKFKEFKKEEKINEN